jgi:hypothetical protein
MPTLNAGVALREASIDAVVIRADGRREPLGVIAYYHKNPLRRMLWRLMHVFLRH